MIWFSQKQKEIIQTEKRYPCVLLGGMTSVKGENQWTENLPKTAWMLFHLDFRAHLASSFLSDSMPVSSYQMALTWVPNMMAVKRAKRRPSKMRKRSRMMVAGGEKAWHVFHSEPRQYRKWLMARNSAWNDIDAM